MMILLPHGQQWEEKQLLNSRSFCFPKVAIFLRIKAEGIPPAGETTDQGELICFQKNLFLPSVLSAGNLLSQLLSLSPLVPAISFLEAIFTVSKCSARRVQFYFYFRGVCVCVCVCVCV